MNVRSSLILDTWIYLAYNVKAVTGKQEKYYNVRSITAEESSFSYKWHPKIRATKSDYGIDLVVIKSMIHDIMQRYHKLEKLKTLSLDGKKLFLANLCEKTENV